MKNLYSLRFPMLVFVILLFGFIGISIELKQLKEFSKQYQLVSTELSLNGILVKLSKKKGIAYVKINNRKLVFRPSANHNYRKEYLIDNLFVNDSIVKESGTDTIRVYRNQKVYIFILNDVIPNSDPVEN